MEGMTPPGGWTQAFIDHLGIELWRIPVVVASAIGIYLAFLLLVRVFGVRVLSGWTGFDAVVLIMLGSVAGRVIIGHPPTLAAGAIGLLTLLLLEAAFGAVQQAAGVPGGHREGRRVGQAHALGLGEGPQGAGGHLGARRAALGPAPAVAAAQGK